MSERIEYQKIAAQYPDAVEEVYEFRGDTWLYIRKERLLEVCRLLHNDPDLGYLYISDITALDWLPYWEKGEKPKRFEVVYNLYSPVSFGRIFLKVRVDDGEPVPSVTGIWEGASYPEREVYDIVRHPVRGASEPEADPDARRLGGASAAQGLPAGRRGNPLRTGHLGTLHRGQDAPTRRRIVRGANRIGACEWAVGASSPKPTMPTTSPTQRSMCWSFGTGSSRHAE